MLLLSLTALVDTLHPAAGDDANGLQWSALCFSLILVAVGTGGIKPNVSTFGADQFDDKDPRDAKGKESFFNWFYLSINIGALIASTVIVQVQHSIGWGVGFGIPGEISYMTRQGLSEEFVLELLIIYPIQEYYLFS